MPALLWRLQNQMPETPSCHLQCLSVVGSISLTAFLPAIFPMLSTRAEHAADDNHEILPEYFSCQ
jgi:hypothetical protein